jgi:hypothetical protein
LRHTYCSLLIARGEDPTYAMTQLGHTDPGFTLRIYAHQMRRRDGERDRLRALIDGADWAIAGTKGPNPVADAAASTAAAGAETACEQGIPLMGGARLEGATSCL